MRFARAKGYNDSRFFVKGYSYIKLAIASLATLIILSLGSCTNPSTPGGQTPPEPVFGDFVLKMAASNGTPNRDNTQLQDGQITITDIRIVLEEINFEGASGSEQEIEFEGPFVSQLVESSSYSEDVIPDIPITQIDFDDYATIKLKIAKIQEDEFNSELLADPISQLFLQDQSIVIEGAFQESLTNDIDGSGTQNSIVFRLISDLDAEVEISTPNTFTVSNQVVNYFFVAFRVDQWFVDALTLMQTLPSAAFADGIVSINDDSVLNPVQQLLAQIEDDIKTSLKMAPSSDEDFEEDD